MTIKKPPEVTFKDIGRELKCSFYPMSEPLYENIGRLSRFYDIWKNKFNSDTLPAWKDFSFEDFIGWHSHMRVMDIGGSLEDYKKNLIIGEDFAKYFGKKTFYELIRSDIPLKQTTKDAYDKYLELIYDHHYCISVGTVPDNDGISHKFSWIDMPLSGDGKKVSHIITAIQFNRK